MTRYLVVGIYADNNQRWAESFMAADAEHAEKQAHDATGHELIIAAVITGEDMVVVA